MLCACKVSGLIRNSDTLENIRQTLCLLLVAGEQSIFSVKLHLTCGEHLCLLDLRAAQLHRWLLVVLIRGVANTAALSLVCLGLLSRGLVDGSPILLRNLALHHVDAATLQLLTNGLLLAFPLGLFSARLHLVVCTGATLALLCIVGVGVLLGDLDLCCDDGRTVDVVQCVVQDIEVHAVFIGWLLEFNLDLLVRVLVLLHKSVHGFQQRNLVIQTARAHDLWRGSILGVAWVLSGLGSGLLCVALEAELFNNLTARVVQND